jgi:SM-20-related protein
MTLPALAADSTDDAGTDGHRPTSETFADRGPRAWLQQLDVASLEEFLVPSELAEVRASVLAQEERFTAATVGRAKLDDTHRRARVLPEPEGIAALYRARVAVVVPFILERFGVRGVTPHRLTVQVTSTGDGEFFGPHLDSSADGSDSRQLSFVHFIHAEPKAFVGGELKLYDVAARDLSAREHAPCTTVVPAQNTMVVFPGRFLHEITPVTCPSQRFSDSRLTVNGWIHW